MLMQPTPGITEPHFCRDPLGTEGELTEGPDDYNPFDDPRWEPDDETVQPAEPPGVVDDIGFMAGPVAMPAFDPPEPDFGLGDGWL